MISSDWMHDGVNSYKYILFNKITNFKIRRRVHPNFWFILKVCKCIQDWRESVKMPLGFCFWCYVSLHCFPVIVNYFFIESKKQTGLPFVNLRWQHRLGLDHKVVKSQWMVSTDWLPNRRVPFGVYFILIYLNYWLIILFCTCVLNNF